ncbi:MAG: hypothetical protein WDZ72_05635 [Cyclobacteriaceae bacterium]
MKTLMTTVLALSIFFSTYANNIFDKSLAEVSSIEIKEQRFMLRLAEGIGQVKVSIFNNKGKLVDRTRFNIQSPLNIPFNLGALPEGNYKVKLETKEERVCFEVITKKKVEKKLLAYGKALDPHTLMLKVAGIEKPGITVTLFDQNHDKLASDKIHVLGSFSRNYVLKNLRADEVYMKVMDAEGKHKFLYFN